MSAVGRAEQLASPERGASQARRRWHGFLDLWIPAVWEPGGSVGPFPRGVQQRLTELVALEPWWCGLARRCGGGALPGDLIGRHLPSPLNPGLVGAVNCLMHILAASPGASAPEAAAAALERICTSCGSPFWACCLPLKYVRESAFCTSRLSVGGPRFALLFWDLECLGGKWRLGWVSC